MKRMLWIAPGVALAMAAGAAAQTPLPAGQTGGGQSDSQLLSNAVSALKTVDSGLSQRLSQVAAKPNGETDVPGLPGVPTPPQDLKAIHDAASALRASSPDLAARLDTYADRLNH